GPARALEGSLRAAERALRTYAFEDAVAILEQALRTIDARTLDPRAHCEALLLLGEAQIRAHREGRATCLQAAEIARQLNDAGLLARAGLALGAEIWAGRVNPTLVGLLEEALRALPETASSIRARVLARLAGALQPAFDPTQPMEIAREAIAMARTLGDEACLRTVLMGAGSALVDYATPRERLDVDAQTLELARAAQDWPLAFRAGLRLFFVQIELGGWSEAAAIVETCASLAEKQRRPRLRWYVALLRALLCDVRGDFDAADGFRRTAAELMAREEDDGLRMPFAMHTFAHALLRHEHEHILERLPGFASIAVPGELGETILSVLRALCDARAGRLEQAAEVLQRIDLRAPYVHHDMTLLHALGEIVALCQLREPAALLLGSLREQRDRIVSWGVFGLAALVPMSSVYAALAALLGRHDEALPAFQDAAVRCRQLNARPALARVLHDWSRALVARNQPGDAERGRELLAEANSLAREMAMPGLLAWIDAKPAPSAPPPVAAGLTPETFSLQREADVWLIRHGERSFRLKHSRGLELLARLVEEPGRELHALQLASGGDPGNLGDAGEAVDPQAVRAYRARIEALREREQTAETLGDSDAAERARGEIEQIAGHLSAALGLGGKGRKAAAASERARVNVQRRIKDAIARIAAEDPVLGRYLRICVRTGTFSAFEPLSSSRT
ncbi:MAG TPA: hypothetical protein VJV78_19575, partial [Polyangiales bacterium]|nr:hypothetical protein [Polyangiales bacterium]